MAKRGGKPFSGLRAILAVLVSAKATDTDERIRAFTAALAERGVEVVGSLVQRRGVSRSSSPGGSKHLDAPLSSATFIGPGKVDELRELAQARDATVIYFLNQLSAAQTMRLSALTGCSVVACPNLVPPM